MTSRWRCGLAILVGAVGIGALGLMPTETKQGINGVVTSHRLPLYAKTLDFLQRDSTYGRLAGRIVPEDATPGQKALTLFEWTRQNILDSPRGLPVVDDHISHIIIRGYGDPDQKADVFTTLLTYAGVPAYWIWVGKDGKGPFVLLSLAWIDGAWRAFDVQNGIVFRTARGTLASVEELARDPWVLKAEEGRVYRERPYPSFFDGFAPPVAPDLLRAELQMLWPRAFYRGLRFVGLGRREWQQAR